MDKMMASVRDPFEPTACVEAATRALEKLLGRDIQLDPPSKENKWFRFRISGWHTAFRAAVYPRPVHPKSIGALANWLTGELDDATGSARQVAILEQVTAKTAERLRKWNVCFVDAAGNAYLEGDGCFIFVVGQKGKDAPRPHYKDRAFTRSGLQVVFGLLADPVLLNWNYREIAHAVGVSHGTVGIAMESMRTMGYLSDAGERRLLMRQDELRMRWAAGYAETLRPRLLRNRFRFTEPSQAHERVRSLPPEIGLWSGEPGADLITEYLQPGSYTLFSKAPPSELARVLGAVRDEHGSIEVLRPFWAPTWSGARSKKDMRATHSLLVWADLLAAGDARAKDVAGMVLDVWNTELQERET